LHFFASVAGNIKEKYKIFMIDKDFNPPVLASVLYGLLILYIGAGLFSDPSQEGI